MLNYRKFSVVLFLVAVWPCTLSSAELPKLVDSPAADLVFGPAAPARIYTSWQAAKWGLDFLFAWSRAADRDILYGYKIARLTPEQWQQIFVPIKLNQNKVAIINVLANGPLPVLGPDRGYLAAPLVEVSPSKDEMPGFLLTIGTQDFRSSVMPGAVAIAALKGAGVEVSNLLDVQSIFDSAGAETTYVATSHAIADLQPDQYFMIPKTAWTIPAGTTNLTWGMNFPSAKRRIE
jgi:hypothetical protein